MAGVAGEATAEKSIDGVLSFTTSEIPALIIWHYNSCNISSLFNLEHYTFKKFQRTP